MRTWIMILSRCLLKLLRRGIYENQFLGTSIIYQIHSHGIPITNDDVFWYFVLCWDKFSNWSFELVFTIWYQTDHKRIHSLRFLATKFCSYSPPLRYLVLIQNAWIDWWCLLLPYRASEELDYRNTSTTTNTVGLPQHSSELYNNT